MAVRGPCLVSVCVCMRACVCACLHVLNVGQCVRARLCLLCVYMCERERVNVLGPDNRERERSVGVFSPVKRESSFVCVCLWAHVLPF